MKTTVKRWAALALASALAMGVYTPAEAVTVPVPAPKVETSGDVIQARHRDYRPPYYYRGYRGYRHPRPGYRYHNGYWFPLAAFGAGLVIGGALAAPPPRVRGGLSPQHYRWCQARYRSYDSYSNTFQPYQGPRRQCVSPYY